MQLDVNLLFIIFCVSNLSVSSFKTSSSYRAIVKVNQYCNIPSFWQMTKVLYQLYSNPFFSDAWKHNSKVQNQLQFSIFSYSNNPFIINRYMCIVGHLIRAECSNSILDIIIFDCCQFVLSPIFLFKKLP